MGKIIDKLIEIHKKMKGKGKIMKENYAIKQTAENTWVIIDEDENIVNTITKEDIMQLFNDEFECPGLETVISDVWYELDDCYNIEKVDDCCQEFDKFIAWFEYICAEYYAKEIVAFYKQVLLHFE